jgi:pimeloyl-ACP methyl ester carboxylesterase
MNTFVLIHGAGGGAWYWHLLVAALRRRGHDTIAMDLPSDDESAGLSEYADAVVDASGDRTDLVVVGQSFGGFTAALVCQRVPAKLLVLVAGMIPSPGERPQDWCANTGLCGGEGRADRGRHRDGGGRGRRDRDVLPRRSCGAGSRSAEEGGLRRVRRCGSRGHSRLGQTCRPGSCCAATIACFRRSSCAGRTRAPRRHGRRDRRRALRGTQPAG